MNLSFRVKNVGDRIAKSWVETYEFSLDRNNNVTIKGNGDIKGRTQLDAAKGIVRHWNETLRPKDKRQEFVMMEREESLKTEKGNSAFFVGKVDQYPNGDEDSCHHIVYMFEERFTTLALAKQYILRHHVKYGDPKVKIRLKDVKDDGIRIGKFGQGSYDEWDIEEQEVHAELPKSLQ